MNVKILAEIMESVKPDGWDYFAYKYYSDYNKQKDVNDAFVFELPRDWPLRWDGGCQNPLTFNLWLGKVVGIKPTQPFLDTATELELEAEQLLWRLDQWEFIRITEKPKAVWYDAPEGAIVNAQVWIKIPLTIIAYNTLPDPVPPPFTPPPLITAYVRTVVDVVLLAADWVSKEQTISVAGVTANSVNLISIETLPDMQLWVDNMVLATSQAADEITFICDTEPLSDIGFKIVILK